MLNKIKHFGKKIALIVTALVAFSVISITLLSFYLNRKTVKENFHESVELHNKLYLHEIEKEFRSLQTQVAYIEAKERLFTIPFIQLNNTINGLDTSKNKFAELTSYFKKEIFNELIQNPIVENVYLLNTTQPEPIVIFESGSILLNNKTKNFKNIDNVGVNIHVKKPNINQPILESGRFYTYVSHPIYIEDVVFGMVMVKVDLAKVAKKVKIQETFLEKTKLINEVVKLEKKNIFKVHVSKDSSVEFYEERENVLYPTIIDNWMKVSNYYYDFDIENRNQLNYWSYNKELGICVLTKLQISLKEYNKGNFNYLTLLIGFGIVLTSLVIALYFARVISYPIIKLKRVLKLVSKGVLPNKLNSPLSDEVGEMITTVNKIVNSLKKTAEYAQKIGQGEFATDFQPLSKQDILGNALVDMSESLQNANIKDVVRNWIIEGLASLGEILRNHDSVQKISEEVIQFICYRVEALQGAFFLLEESDEDQDKLVMKATYAYGKFKNIKRQFYFGEGIIGQCAAEKNIILRSEIPDNYMLISSGILGDQHPSHLLVVPLIYNDKVYGVIELASLSMFESDKIDFMEEVGAIISRTIFNINVNENTRNLLEKSQVLGQELTDKKEELEQNANKMAKTQVEITEANQKLEEQISKVREAQERQTALLTNSDEVIFILNQAGLVKYVSPSVQRVLGYQEEDVIDSRDSKRVHDLHQTIYTTFFTNILNNAIEEQKIQYEYYKKDGRLVWLESVGTNQINNSAINGLVINVRDITIKKQAEDEQRRRSQMQSLSENSTDLIMRVGVNRQVFYANPVIESYTNLSIENLLSKKIQDTFLNKYMNNAYVEMLEKVSISQEIAEIEADFKSDKANEIFSIRGIPEFDRSGKLETVLMISHNVTAAKTIEREIKEKSKQIEDSIYYAENIQKVILPDSSLLQKYVPNSFILFKPRDIVSGDFPWVKEHNGYLYLAAVDCTGHGVPGAMIATVGYFLLNGILSNVLTPNSAEVLTQLDALLTATFNQNDETSKLKDGMDMVLCRLKIGTNDLDIASANRPILHINSQKELIEIKGNKFPIGGGLVYDKSIGFTLHNFRFQKGESIYFFSDGLQDQFCQLGNEKFGTKRIKSWLVENEAISFSEKHSNLDNAFEDWKGNSSQTDDILFIGLGF